jgi:HD-GYP domain-containing protein (c-di-GMP phosphodiesterase class II)
VSNNPKGGVSLSKVLTTGVRKYGQSIVNNLSIALKVTRLYSFRHQNVTDALSELLEFLQSFVRLEGSAQLLRVGDFLFLNEVRVRIDLGGYESFSYVLELLKERDIGEITFSGGITQQELEELVELLNKPCKGVIPWDAFSAISKGHRFGHISIAQHKERPDLAGDVDEDARAIAIRSYFKTVGIVGGVLKAARDNRKMNLRRVKLVVHALVDLTLGEERLLLSLANTKDHGIPGANHATNVCVLALALGTKLGLSKKILGDLAIAALLHDVGKVRIPEALVKKTRAEFTPQEHEAFQGHVSGGVERLLKQRVLDSIVKSINVAFLHHYRYDCTGYPKLLAAKQQNLFTRIIAVANYYDNATTTGCLQAEALTPEQAMNTLMDRGGTEFDPIAVKAFVNLMGLYPVGCVVRLDSGEVATVIEPASHPRFLDRPSVKLINDANGNPSSRVIRLMDRKPGGGFPHSILKIYQQEEVNLDLEEYLAVI